MEYVQRYCVRAAPSPSGGHEVHCVHCSKVPPPRDRVELGYCRSGHDALDEARRHFVWVEPCERCMRDC